MPNFVDWKQAEDSLDELRQKRGGLTLVYDWRNQQCYKKGSVTKAEVIAKKGDTIEFDVSAKINWEMKMLGFEGSSSGLIVSVTVK